MINTINLLLALWISTNPLYSVGVLPMDKVSAISFKQTKTLLSEKSFSLDKRYDGSEFVNGVFKDNILLTLNYLNGNITKRSDIDWGEIDKPNAYQFTLAPGESFAFHDQYLPEIKNVTKTTNAHFNYQDGFKSDGYLMGDGVCHLASILYWAAKDAGLETFAPTNHDFAKINEVPKEYGVSIYSLPGGFEKSSRENLYITNNYDEDVSFVFFYDGNRLSILVTKSNS